MRHFDPSRMKKTMIVAPVAQLEATVKSATEEQHEQTLETIEKGMTQLATQLDENTVQLKAAHKTLARAIEANKPAPEQKRPTEVRASFERDAQGRIKSPIIFTITR
jgi:allophanate hydrolase subunit 1